MNLWRKLTQRWRKEPVLPIPPHSGYRYFKVGDPIPIGWMTVKLDDRPNARHGIITFGCDVEVTFRDDCLRVHALEDGGVFRFLGVNHARIRFNHKVRVYDPDGKPLTWPADGVIA